MLIVLVAIVAVMVSVTLPASAEGKKPTFVNIAVSTSHLDGPGRVSVSGAVTNLYAEHLAGARVVLTVVSLRSGRVIYTGATVTNSAGNYGVVFTITGSVEFRAQFPGSPSYAASAVQSRRTYVGEPEPDTGGPAPGPTPSTGSSEFVLDGALKETLCGWIATTLKAPAIVSGPEGGAVVTFLSKEYKSGCVGGTPALKAETVQNIIETLVDYRFDKNLSIVFEKQVDSLLAGINRLSQVNSRISNFAWNRFVLDLIQHLKSQEVSCEQASPFPPPPGCSTQTLTNQLLSLLRK